MQHWRALIAYASRLGSTREVAEAVAAVLRQRGLQAELRPVEQVRSLEGYGAVVVGSPVREGRWLPEARRFVRAHREALRRLPLVYFAVAGVMSDPTPEHFHQVYDCLAEVRELAEPLEVGLFAGSLDYGQLSREQAVKVLGKGLPAGDFRRWQDIRAWAEDTADRLQLEFARLSPNRTGS